MRNIGKVISVTPENLIFEVTDHDKLHFNFLGNTYRTKGVLDYVTIKSYKNIKYLYQVIKIEDKEFLLEKSEQSKFSYNIIFSSKPVGFIENNKINFNLFEYPFVNDEVFITSHEEKELLFESENNKIGNIKLGIIDQIYDGQVNVNSLFGHHTAIIGNTGSGKSNTIRHLLSEINTLDIQNAHFHVIDVHDEYSFGNHKNFNNVDLLRDYQIAYTSLDEQDWINLFKPSELVQLPVLYTALKIGYLLDNQKIRLKSLKAYIALTMYNTIQTDTITKRTKIISVLNGFDHPSILKYHSQYGNFTENDEKVFINFLKSEIEEDVEKYEDYNEMWNNKLKDAEYKIKNNRALLEGLEFAFLLEEMKGNNQIRQHCVSLETRINNIFVRFKDLFVEEKINSNLLENQNLITIYKVNEVEDDVLLFFTSYLLKKYFSINKTKEYSNRTINIFILEEAHRYISKERENSFSHELELFKTIAREGRKFGCFLLLSSQRPSELSPTILSQCNNYIIHRIKNNFDLEYMLSTVPYLSKHQLSRISYLPTGNALLVGDLFSTPIEILVNESLYNHSSNTPEIIIREQR